MNFLFQIVAHLWQFIVYVYRYVFHSVRHFLRHQLHPEIKYLLTIIAFWPSVVINRAYCYLYPEKRRLYDRITPTVLLGSVPLHRDIQTLQNEKVTKVINLCREFPGHVKLYKETNIKQLHLPVIDFSVPTAHQIETGVRFLHEHHVNQKNLTAVYVHCKAGRGRSTTIVLAYLLSIHNISPIEADAIIRRTRPHVSNKTQATEILEWISIYRPAYFTKEVEKHVSKSSPSKPKRRSLSKTDKRKK